MYKKLPYWQYFMDTTGGFDATVSRARYVIDYHTVSYRRFLIKYLAEWEAHFEPNRNVIQVNLQYSNDTADWFANFDWPHKYYGSFMTTINGEVKEIQLRVHVGWAEMYKSMRHQIREKVRKLFDEHPNAYLEIVGHSLGSGLAMLCAQDLNFNLGKKAHLFTFGSTNPFYYKKKDKDTPAYLSSICEEVYNFKNKNDFVCYCPPIPGFHAINPVKIQKFNIFKLLFKTVTTHSHYYYRDWYDGIK